MKVIPKYLSGGSYESFFTTYVPIRYDTESSSQSTSSSSNRSSSTGELTEKDFFSMLKDIDGLPNDMREIIGGLTSMFRMSNLTGLNTRDLSTTYLESLYKIRVANLNYNEYLDAMKTASKNGSLAEPAISLDGRLVAQDNEGNLSYVTLDQYYEAPEDYHLLSVSNLANLRKYDPALAYNQSVLDIINNSTGYEEFLALVDLAKLSLGSTKYSETSVSSREALEGLQILDGMNDELKEELLDLLNTGTYKVSNESNIDLIRSLINYVSSVLPSRVKTWAAIKLNNPNKEEAITQLVSSYLIGGLRQSLTIQASAPKTSGKSSSPDKETDASDFKIYGTPAKFLSGAGVRNSFTINSGTNHAYQVNVSTLPLTDKDDNPLGVNSTMLDVSKGTYSPILDFNNISVGGVILNPASLNGVVLLDGRINSVDYPIDMEAYNRDGTIIPDTSPAKAKAKLDADRELRSLGVNINDQELIRRFYNTINQVYEKYELAPPYDSKGNPSGEWRRFGVINVAVNNSLLGLGLFNKNPLLREIKDDTIVDNLRQISEDLNFSNPREDYYSGTLWIPVLESYVAATAGEKMKGSEILALNELDLILQERSSWKSGRQLLQ